MARVWPTTLDQESSL